MQYARQDKHGNPMPYGLGETFDMLKQVGDKRFCQLFRRSFRNGQDPSLGEYEIELQDGTPVLVGSSIQVVHNEYEGIFQKA